MENARPTGRLSPPSSRSQAPPERSRRWGCGAWVLLAWGVLLLASHLVRWLAPVSPPELGDRQALQIPAFVGRQVKTEGVPPGGEPVRIAFREWPGDTPDAPVLVMLHGSPGSSGDFLRLGPELAGPFRVLAPDLPGFGASERQVPDYSIAAHAASTLAWLDRLGVGKVHVLGFSMGGGVALEMADQAPERVVSLTLLSALGVQELELLGDYRLNHAVHGLQLGLFVFLYEGVPHFGLFDGGMLSVPYARNFYDTDQRPLRRILGNLEMPVLILHGEEDVLVPVEVARESRRLAPQAELVLFHDNHFMVFAGGEALSGPIAAFLERVEQGRAPTRSDVPPEARAAARRPFDPRSIPQAAGVALFVLVLVLAASTLVSEDLTCIAAGVLVAQGRIAFIPAALACLFGIFFGDLLLYLAGRFLGRPWLGRAPLKWFVKADAVARGERWFKEKGAAVIFLSRFTPGTRLATYVAAGLLRASFFRFAFWFFLAATVWTPSLVYGATLLGARAFDYFDVFSRYALLGLIALVALLWLLLKVGLPLVTWKGRRRAVGWWRRLRHWEFWPPWAFYPPVLARVLWLGIRHRGLTLFTAANPAIPDGGFIGESKSAILDGLDPRHVARYRLLPGAGSAAERLAAIHAFLAEHGLELPVVLKPDLGQRGAGVRVARSWEDVEGALAELTGDALVQEYVPGAELGIFYVRLPGEERGRIFSITDKRLPNVVGDGRRTIEELILADPRAVTMARLYLENLADRRREVPAAGEQVRLTDLGTHCRGAVFLDGSPHGSAALEARVEEISRGFDGFYFGRYDMRAPSYDDFRAGRNLKVLELNGVTSEATHIYDPRNSLLAAWRVLFEQWGLAFEIGRRNRDRGAPVTGVRELLRRLIEFRRS